MSRNAPIMFCGASRTFPDPIWLGALHWNHIYRSGDCPAEKLCPTDWTEEDYPRWWNIRDHGMHRNKGIALAPNWRQLYHNLRVIRWLFVRNSRLTTLPWLNRAIQIGVAP